MSLMFTKITAKDLAKLFEKSLQFLLQENFIKLQ